MYYSEGRDHDDVGFIGYWAFYFVLLMGDTKTQYSISNVCNLECSL